MTPHLEVVAPLPVGLSSAELDRWAEDHDVAIWLDRPARVIETGHGAAARWVLQDRTVRDVVLFPDQLAYRGAQLREEAVSFLRRRAVLASAALVEEAEEVARRARGPHREAFRALWARLMAARQSLRAHTAPDGSVDVAPRLVLDESHVRLVYSVDLGGRCSGCGGVEIEVSLADEGPPVPTCRCETDAPGCAARLRALDAVLDLVVRSPREDGGLQDRLEHVAITRRWRRELVALLAVLEPLPAGPDGRHFGWEVRGGPDFEEVRLEPVHCLPRKRAGGFRRWSLRDAQDGWKEGLSDPRDLRVAALAPEGGALRGDVALAALGLLVGHARVFLERRGAPIRVTRAQVGIHWRGSEEAGVEADVRLGSRTLGPAELTRLLSRRRLALSITWDPEGAVLEVVEAPPRAWRLLELLAKRGRSFPVEAVSSLLQQQEALERVLPVDLDPDLRGRAVEPARRLLIRADLAPGPVLGLRARLEPLAGAPYVVPGRGAVRLHGLLDGERVHTERDLEGEVADVTARLAKVGLESAVDQAWELDDPELALDCIHALQTSSDPDLEVTWTRTPPWVPRLEDVSDLELTVQQQRGWFSLGGQAVAEGRAVLLAAVMEAVLDGRRYVRATDDGWVRLSEPFREDLLELAWAARPDGQDLELPLGAAPLVEQLEAEGAELDAPPAFRLPLERLRETAELTVTVPSGLRAELRVYQRDGFAWLARLAHWAPGGCLADDMGLGKTLQALALLLHREATGPALVVAPTSVGFNWLQEAERFAPGLSLRVYRGRGRERVLGDLGPGVLVVTSYELLARDAEALAGVEWGTVVLDEAQAIKNPGTRRAQAARRLLAGFVVALTGTPVENRVEEIWSLFRVLVPGLLGSAEGFRERFVRPLSGEHPGPSRAALAGLVRPFLLRRRKSEVALELPPRTEITLRVDLSAPERALYDRVRRAALQELDEGHPDGAWHIRALAALTRLRQLSCHARLVLPESSVPSSKLGQTVELLEALRDEEHRALVFSQFTSHLALVRTVLEERGHRLRYLDGSMTARRRQAEVEAFQGGEGDHFLISLRAGGTGLNLTAATYVVHLDPWWNPAVEDQATDRAHRIGQDRPVTVYRLVAAETVEEGIMALHAEKRELAEGLLAGTGRGGALTPAEVLTLLGGPH